MLQREAWGALLSTRVRTVSAKVLAMAQDISSMTKAFAHYQVTQQTHRDGLVLHGSQRDGETDRWVQLAGALRWLLT
jgi:hypothetical protein